MKKSIKFFLLNTFISACIGLIVGFIIVAALGLKTDISNYLWASAFIGAIIGTSAKLSVLLLRRYATKKPLVGYTLMFFVSGMLTLLFSYHQDFTTKIIILAVVQPLALLAMYCNIHYFYRLNDGLKRKQEELKQNLASKQDS